MQCLDSVWDPRSHVRNSTKQSAITVALQHLNRLVRQRDTLLLERFEAGFQVREAQFETERRGERLEDAAARGDDLATDAIAGNKACIGLEDGDWGS